VEELTVINHTVLYIALFRTVFSALLPRSASLLISSRYIFF